MTTNPEKAAVAKPAEAAKPAEIKSGAGGAATETPKKPAEDPPETPVPTDEELAAMDAALGLKSGENQLSEEDHRAAIAAVDKIKAMIDSMPSDARDSLTIYGYGGRILNLGDLRALVRGHVAAE